MPFFATREEALAHVGNAADPYMSPEQAQAFLIDNRGAPEFIETYRGLSSSEGVHYVDDVDLRYRVNVALEKARDSHA